MSTETKRRGPMPRVDRVEAEIIARGRGFGSRDDGKIATGNEDIELMREVLEYAVFERARARRQKKKSRFQMNAWVSGAVFKKKENEPPPMPCGTSACLAGTAAAFRMPVGYVMVDDRVGEGTLNPFYSKESAAYESKWRIDSRMDSEEVSTVGQRELGLTDDQARLLFYMPDDLEQLVLVASYVVGEDFRDVLEQPS